jgi:holliday junction DNA helicase RuvA
LRSVSGIGPRMALSVLSGISVADLAAAVAAGNAQRLTAIPGIGRKTAERMLIDLRGKLDAPAHEAASPTNSMEEDAVSALTGLGYKRAEAEKAVRRVGSEDTSLEELLRRALGGLVKDASR